MSVFLRYGAKVILLLVFERYFAGERRESTLFGGIFWAGCWLERRELERRESFHRRSKEQSREFAARWEPSDFAPKESFRFDHLPL